MTVRHGAKMAGRIPVFGTQQRAGRIMMVGVPVRRKLGGRVRGRGRGGLGVGVG